MNELWNFFALSGKIDDYLKYRESEKQEEENADNGEGPDYQGTDSRGE
jgi:hypothetical protein